MLIGAGFSYDLGIPLANDVSKDFFFFYNNTRLKDHINSWSKHEPYGEDNPTDSKALFDIAELFKKHKCNNSLNYEEFLKDIEDIIRSHDISKEYRLTCEYTRGKILDIISYLFYAYHIHYFPIYHLNKHFYKDFSKFIGEDPLWVISLNHDLIIEFLCIDNKIPLSFGSVSKVKFPISNLNFENTLEFGSVDRKDLSLENMNFIKSGKGVNLIKLHGAINEFSYGDFDNIEEGKTIIQLDIKNSDTALDYLKIVSKKTEMKYFFNGLKINTLNELSVSGMDGEIQFLRNSIKMGGHKFSKTVNPKPGEEKLALIDQILDNLDEIIVVGYSFCDEHVNIRLYNAMVRNENLKVWIVDPSDSKIKLFEPFEYDLRVRKVKASTPEWLRYITAGNWDIENRQNLDEFRKIRPIIYEEFRNKHLK
ncbi:hypothetical protein [Methanococcus vannielii]|uniref:hypothetical protein n=1 Tax=Methanococcus vannielii TaxID=2187 RepID=UPI0012EA0A1A|nr:hypothetical protein [Methanococcus vannielii]